MKLSTARAIAWALKLGMAALFGFIVVGNLAGAAVSALFAYTLVVSYPRPFKTIGESLRANWRGFSLVAGIIGLAVFALVFKTTPVAVMAKAILSCFQAGFIGVIFGEIFAKIPLSMVNDKK